MREYPTAYVIPLGAGQRSDPEANRLVEWLLINGIEVAAAGRRTITYGRQTFEEGSYVVWMDQAHRGLADTALGIGDDVSGQIGVALRAARGLEPRLPVGRRRAPRSRRRASFTRE